MRPALLRGLKSLPRNQGASAARFHLLPRTVGRVGNIRYFSDDRSNGGEINAVSGGNSDLVDVGAANAADIGSSIDTVASGFSMYPSDLVQYSIDTFSSYTGLPYWESIIGVTIIFRLLILPIGIMSAKTSATMAIVKPDMVKISDAMKNDPNKNDPATMSRYKKEMDALFKMHNGNPFSRIYFD